MNKLYRLYFYLRFWIAQATKKFIELFLDSFIEYDTEVNAFPIIDTSNTFTINVEEEFDLSASPSNYIIYTLDVVDDLDFNMVVTNTSEASYNLNVLTNFDINPTIYSRNSSQGELTLDGITEFEVSMLATRIAKLNDYSSSENTLNSMSPLNLNRLGYKE